MVDLPIIQAICAVTVLPALLISLVSLYPIRFFAARLGLLDRPGGRKTHAKPIPLGGGIGIWLGTIGTFLAGTIVVALARSNPTIHDRVPSLLREHLEGAWSQVGTLWALLIAVRFWWCWDFGTIDAVCRPGFAWGFSLQSQDLWSSVWDIG